MTICMFVYAGVMLAWRIDAYFRIVCENLLCSLTCYAFSLIPTYWINKQYRKQEKWNMRFSNFNNADDKSQSIRYISLEDILSTKDGFDLFADHLVREFSIENLFFVFEVVQIKNEVLKHRYVST